MSLASHMANEVLERSAVGDTVEIDRHVLLTLLAEREAGWSHARQMTDEVARLRQADERMIAMLTAAREALD